jgi:uncharacterized protein (DUF1330 family)
MAGYAIGDVEVIDEEGYGEYRRRFDAVMVKFGSRLLVNGGAAEAMEGTWVPRRLVVLEFPSAERARAWLTSPEYAEIAPIRYQNARTHFLTIVEGWDEQPSA